MLVHALAMLASTHDTGSAKVNAPLPAPVISR